MKQQLLQSDIPAGNGGESYNLYEISAAMQVDKTVIEKRSARKIGLVPRPQYAAANSAFTRAKTFPPR